MRHVAWRADLTTPDPETGEAEIAAVRLRARQGAPWAIARLRPPRYPARLRYLLDWTKDARQGLGGEPLTWPALDAWARRKRLEPEPHELDAVFLLDTAMRNPRAFLPPIE